MLLLLARQGEETARFFVLFCYFYSEPTTFTQSGQKIEKALPVALEFKSELSGKHVCMCFRGGGMVFQGVSLHILKVTSNTVAWNNSSAILECHRWPFSQGSNMVLLTSCQNCIPYLPAQNQEKNLWITAICY